MIDLKNRSRETELMDRDDIPFTDIAVTLTELNIVNTRLGGHAITCRGVNTLMNGASREMIICEIGCGGGDNLVAIEKKFPGKNIRYIGIDINPECIRYASQKYPALNCEWICSDYAKVSFIENKPDIIFSSLFCHHFSDDQLIAMLDWQYRNSKMGFFVNDLHRHWLAYYLIKYITRFFSRSYLVKNDAAVCG